MSDQNDFKVDPEELKSELKRNLYEAKQNGELFLKTGRDLAAAGQRLVDWSDASEAIVPYLASSDLIQRMNSNWTMVNQDVSAIRGQLAGFSTFPLATSTGISAYTSVAQIAPYVYLETLPPTQREGAQKAVDRIRRLASQPDERNEVIKLLELLNLDFSRSGQKSCLDQFNTAHAAFDRPADASDPSITSLLPMRSCIDKALAQLLQRRPSTTAIPVTLSQTKRDCSNKDGLS
jgi:hypothetical protein